MLFLHRGYAKWQWLRGGMHKNAFKKTSANPPLLRVSSAKLYGLDQDIREPGSGPEGAYERQTPTGHHWQQKDLPCFA